MTRSSPPRRPISDLDYGRFAETVGLKGIRVEAPDDIGPAWNEALAVDHPVVRDVVTDPDVPPLPPHITIEEAKMFALAVAKGDPLAPDDRSLAQGQARVPGR